MMEVDAAKANNYSHPGNTQPSASRNSELIKDRYKMDHENRGYAVILNNREFAEEIDLPERAGTDMDLKRMLSTLRDHWGFKKDNVKFWHNPTLVQMKDIMNKAASKDYSNSDCFVCVILSHGTPDGCIYARDGKIKINELIEPLKEEGLAGKPKLFFIQGCSVGKKEDELVGHDATEDSASDEETIEVRIPTESDFLIAISSVPGSLTMKGSPFIQTLHEVVKDDQWKKEDILSIMTIVNKQCADVIEAKKLNGMPCITSMLTRKLFFNA